MADTHHIQLRDGRSLAYAEYGDPQGEPVLFFHGTPSSRLFRHPDDSIAALLGVRLITADRPGFGLSDPKPGRTLLDWPDDVIELADALKVGQFAVAGVSGGGPYAAACAWKIPGRVTRAALISGMGPLGSPEATGGMMGVQRAIYRWLNKNPGAAGWISPVQALQIMIIARTSPRAYVSLATIMSPPADKVLIRQPAITQLFGIDVREAYRRGTGGHVSDVMAMIGPWGFPLEEIKLPVFLWQGTVDIEVPLSMGQYMAKVIPNCQATFCQGEGHLLVFTHWHEILSALIA